MEGFLEELVLDQDLDVPNEEAIGGVMCID